MHDTIINFLKHDLNWDMNLLSLLEPIGGLNNNNFRAIYSNNSYFIRLCEPNLFNINRKTELNILNKASSLNLCTTPIYFNDSTGNMIYKWIDGHMPTEVDINSEDFLNSLCINLKKLHLLSYEAYFNPFIEIIKRIKICNSLKLSLPSYINPLIDKLNILEKELEKNKLIGLCHNDLNISNILISKTSLYIIDYEFSGMGDIFFDLATIAWLQNYNGRINLLKSYFGTFNIKDYDKLLNYIYVVKLLNALWSLIKSVHSSSDYNYENGSNIIFEELYSQL